MLLDAYQLLQSQWVLPANAKEDYPHDIITEDLMSILDDAVVTINYLHLGSDAMHSQGLQNGGNSAVVITILTEYT